MIYKSANEQAFTLIEVIVTLVILGIVGVLAGYGIVQMTQGYVYSNINAETQQKALLAMNRIEKELLIVSYVDPASTSSSLTYTSNKQGITASHTLMVSGSTITIDGNTLVDFVSGFSLSYYNTNDIATPSTTWLPSNSKIIQYTISLTDKNGNATSFTSRAVPRNL
ncbi:MAG: type II secretion system protein [Nitrospirae bacterium]|nr:type II secretion system protein [Nitrospirota bacterium]